MERTLPKESKDATLWECEEQALRFILEDGKLSLSLRMMEEWVTYRYRENRKPPEDHTEVSVPFEEGLGVMLKNALYHIEAIQTVDMPLLFSVIRDVAAWGASEAGAEDESKYGRRMPGVVFQLLCATSRFLERVGEDRVIGLATKDDTLSALVKHFGAHAGQMETTDIRAGAEALSHIFGSETFSGRVREFVRGDKEVAQGIVAANDAIADMVASDSDFRRLVRPLTDVLRAARRAAQ
jgi:hypothetical protein